MDSNYILSSFKKRDNSIDLKLVKKFCLLRLNENYQRMDAASSMEEVAKLQGSNALLKELLTALSAITLDEV